MKKTNLILLLCFPAIFCSLLHGASNRPIGLRRDIGKYVATTLKSLAWLASDGSFAGRESEKTKMKAVKYSAIADVCGFIDHVLNSDDNFSKGLHANALFWQLLEKKNYCKQLKSTGLSKRSKNILNLRKFLILIEWISSLGKSYLKDKKEDIGKYLIVSGVASASEFLLRSLFGCRYEENKLSLVNGIASLSSGVALGNDVFKTFKDWQSSKKEQSIVPQPIMPRLYTFRKIKEDEKFQCPFCCSEYKVGSEIAVYSCEKPGHECCIECAKRNAARSYEYDMETELDNGEVIRETIRGSSEINELCPFCVAEIKGTA